jgi:hypothetical protein
MVNDNFPTMPLISTFPDILREAHANAQDGWGGTTVDMMRASYDVIEVLQSMWLRLARAYPDGHFDNISHEDYIRRYVQDRFVWHRAINEPDGVGTGGTIVGPLSAGAVMRDLERMVEQTVLAVLNRGITDDDVNSYRHWLAAWREAGAGKD